MTSEWYYMKDGQQIGPLSASDLKTLAESGELNTEDLVWKDGLTDWKPASKIRGLLPSTRAATSSRILPPLPQTSSLTDIEGPIDSESTSNAGRPPKTFTVLPTPSKPTRTLPPLPMFAVANATLTITRKAKLNGLLAPISISVDGQSQGTIGGGLITGILDLLTSKENSFAVSISPGKHSIEAAGAFLRASTMLEAKAGHRYVLTTYFTILGILGGGLRLKTLSTGTIETSCLSPIPKQSRRMTLKGLLSLGLFCLAFYLPVSGAIRGCAQSFRSVSISQVRNGQLDAFPGATVGQLVDNFLGSPQWSEGKGEDGEQFVNAQGTMNLNNKPVQAVIQFIIDGKQFELHAFEMNGIPQNNLYKAALFKKMYEEYQNR